MKNDVPCFVTGPAVAAFDAQMEAEESGILFTSDQWLSAQQIPPSGLRPPAPIPRARGSIPPPMESADTTQQIPIETLEQLIDLCRKPAHPCLIRRT